MTTSRAQTRFDRGLRWRTREDRDGLRMDPALRLIVVIPALNEEATIERVVRAVPRSMTGIREVDVLVIDDGSTDRTAELAVAAGAEVIHHTTPRGVGSAFQTALNEAIEHGADLIVNIDADGQFDPADIPRLVAPVVAGEADFATASRFLDPTLIPEMPWIKRWGNRQMSRLISGMTRQKFHDVSCGMRCYNRRAALSLNLLGRFTYTQEVFLNLAYKHMRIVEVPIRVRGVREFGKSRVAGSIFKYASKTSRIIFRCYRDYFPMRFFGAIGLSLLGLAAIFGGFLLWHYLGTGTLSPHKWAGFISGGCALLSVFFFFAGMIGDMLNRHRVYLEELLYRQRLMARGDSSYSDLD
ncbi:MAG TPA: glycosyltransferase family 2 protein [Phycisphaerae bacterium]|nr:glycosyltransferase family 2 protein [Phycisphaerae bacterium]HRW55530.1 glycosyltransferase family 2 protein [Phycisphaerae bacterium]